MRLYRVTEPATVRMFKAKDKAKRQQLKAREMQTAAKIAKLTRAEKNGGS